MYNQPLLPQGCTTDMYSICPSRPLVLWYRAAPWSSGCNVVWGDCAPGAGLGSCWLIPLVYCCHWKGPSQPPAYPLLPQFSVICKCDKNKPLIVQVVDVVISLGPSINLKNTAHNSHWLDFEPSNHYSLSLVAQPAFAQPFNLPIKSMSPQFGSNDAAGDRLENFAKAKVNGIPCYSLVWASHCSRQ